MQVCPTPEPSNPPPISLTKEGRLRIGEQVFNVQIAGFDVHNNKMLKFVEKSLNKSLDSQALLTALHTVSTQLTSEKIHIVTNQSGVVVKLHDTAIQVASIVRKNERKPVEPSRFIIITKLKETLQKCTAFFAEITFYKLPLLVFELREEHALSPIVFCEDSEYAAELTRIFTKKGYSQAEVQQAVGALLEEPHMDILAAAEYRVLSMGSEKSMADLLQEPGNEKLRDEVIKLKTTYAPQEAPKKTSAGECERDLRLFVLCNMQRNPKMIAGVGGTQFVQTISQGKKSADPAALVSQDTHFRKHRGWPSEADKGKLAKSIYPHNTNLGNVVQHNADESKKCVVMGRSGKTDNPERMKDLLISLCMEQLDCQNPVGLSDDIPVDGCKAYTFQHMITSYLDPSFLKALPEYLMSAVKDPEDESVYLANILKACENWKEEGFWIEKKDAPNGKVYVILKKPIVMDQLFSTTLRGIGAHGKQIADLGQTKANKINFEANAHLLELYREKYAILHFGFPTKSFPPDFFSTSAYPACQRAIRDFLEGECKMKEERSLLAQSLYVLFFRQDPKGKKGEELHAADIEIWRNIAAHKFNISQSKQCKSGTDRTAIGVALAVAQAQFRDDYKREFIPTNPSLDELKFFKKKFTEAIKQFGLSMTTETKGHFGLRWGGGVPLVGGVGNPVALKYLESGEVSHTAEKYEEKLFHPEQLYGKTTAGIQERLKKLFAKLNPQDVLNVQTGVQTALLALGCDIPEPFLNDQLELLCHIQDLALDAEKIKKLQEQLSEQKSIDRKTQNLVHYVLNRILFLWQESDKAKRIHAMLATCKKII